MIYRMTDILMSDNRDHFLYRNYDNNIGYNRIEHSRTPLVYRFVHKALLLIE